jgi:hypothetical protein
MKTNNLKSSLYIAICLIIFTFKLKAQDDDLLKAMVMPSQKGNYIRIFGQDALENIKIGENKFIVKRKRLDETNFKTVAIMKMVESQEEAAKYIPDKDLKEFEKMMGVPLIDHLKTKPDYKAISLFGETNLGFLQSFGLAVLDNTVEKGHYYIYKIYQQKDQDQETLFTETSSFFDQTNRALDSVSIKINKVTGQDSLVGFSWDVKIGFSDLKPLTEKTNLFDKISSETLKADRTTYDKIRRFFNTEAKEYSQFLVNDFNLNFKIYYRINKETKWTFHSNHLAGTDSLNNKFIHVEVKCNPEDLVETMVIPEDFVGNKAVQSDIYRGVAVTNNSVVLIYGINSKDSTNSIVLDWAKLPNKSYYSGIELLRSTAGEDKKSIMVLPITANRYIDYDVYPAGTIFTYYIRPVFIENQDLMQETPASTAQSCTSFSKPLPPFNLEIVTEGRFPKLTWEAINEKSIFSYYVYRGTSPTKYDLISTSVRTREYIDSSDYLSPRLTYYYKVSALNLTQDSSAHCPYVSYAPDIPITDMYTPDLVQAEVINGEAWLKWNEVKLNDDFVEGYVLQRKEIKDKEFKMIHTGLLNTANFVDTTFKPGIEYLYRVASVSIRRDTAAFSKETEISLAIKEEKINPIIDIKAKNLSETIRISWPAIDTDNIASYKVLRKLPTDLDFKVIGEVPKNLFDFEDEDVEIYETYIYTITAIDKKGKESEIVQKKSIYREN